MLRRIRPFILLVLWPFFFYACASTEIVMEPVAGKPPNTYKDTKILAVQMQSGDLYRFSEAHPARVVEKWIWGNPLERKEIPLDQLEKLTKDREGNVIEIVDKKGATRWPILGRVEKETLTAYFESLLDRSVSLLYSQVGLITYKEPNKMDAAQAVVIWLCAVGLGAVALVLPFIL